MANGHRCVGSGCRCCTVPDLEQMEHAIEKHVGTAQMSAEGCIILPLLSSWTAAWRPLPEPLLYLHSDLYPNAYAH